MTVDSTAVRANILWMLVERCLRLGIAFLVGLWVARKLGPDMYGMLSYSQATIATVAFLSLVAIDAIVMRCLVDEPDAQPEILGSAILLRTVGGSATFLAVVLIGNFVPTDKEAVAFIAPIIAAGTMFQSTDIIDCWFRLKLLARVSAITRSAALMLGGSVRIVAVHTQSPLEALAWAILFESAFNAAATIAAARISGLPIRELRFSLVRAREIVGQALPLVLSAISVGIYVRLGFILLGNISGTYQVGLFGGVTLFVEALHAVAIAVASTVGPIILKQRHESMKDFDSKILALTRGLSLIGIGLATLVCTISGPLVEQLFGDEYNEGAPILFVLVWSIVFVYMSVAAEIWLIGHGLQKYLVPKTICAAIVSVVAILVLVPRWGAVGLACSTVMSYAFSAFISNALFKNTRPLFSTQVRALMVFGSLRRFGHPAD